MKIIVGNYCWLVFEIWKLLFEIDVEMFACMKLLEIHVGDQTITKLVSEISENI